MDFVFQFSPVRQDNTAHESIRFLRDKQCIVAYLVRNGCLQCRATSGQWGELSDINTFSQAKTDDVYDKKNKYSRRCTSLCMAYKPNFLRSVQFIIF